MVHIKVIRVVVAVKNCDVVTTRMAMREIQHNLVPGLFRQQVHGCARNPAAASKSKLFEHC